MKKYNNRLRGKDMKPGDFVIAQIRHQETTPVPYTLQFDSDELMAKLDLAYQYQGLSWRDRMVPYMKTVTTVIDFDCQEMIDASHYQDAFGTIWRYDMGAPHIESPGLREPSLAKYQFPEPAVFINEKKRQAALDSCRDQPDSFLYAWAGRGIFERSWTIRGMENMLMDIVLEQDFYEELLDRITSLYLEFIKVMGTMPMDAIAFGDDWGDQRGIIVGPERWRKIFKPRVAKMFESIHKQGMYTMNHCCGNVSEIIPDLIEIGLDVLESVQPEAMNPYELKKKWGDKLTFWGGIGSQSIIPFGSPQAIQAEIKHLCQDMGRGGGYILAPSKGLQPDTPVENAMAMIETFNNQS